MATLRNKRKLAAVTRETQEEHPRNDQSRKTSVPRINEDYNTPVFEEIEDKVTEKMSQEFSRTESRILGALSKIDGFPQNPQVRTCSVAVPGTSRNSDSENREPTRDRSLNDPCPEVLCLSHHSGHLNSSEVEEYPHMVTGGPEEILNRSHMVTGIREENPYCSPGTSSGKQKKANSTSQPHLRSENTPATIEADQILLALQQLASNSNSANINNINNKISKLPKSVTTTMPTCDGKAKKFELFEDLFQTSVKIHNQLTEEDKIKYFHSFIRGDALHTLKNISSRN